MNFQLLLVNIWIGKDSGGLSVNWAAELVDSQLTLFIFCLALVLSSDVGEQGCVWTLVAENRRIQLLLFFLYDL